MKTIENLKEIIIGKIYYFNNRQVKALRMEDENFIFVAAIFNINHEVTGSNFCEPCNIDSKSSHTCSEYNEAIEYIMEDISDEDVFWVHKKYLRSEPFEFKENITLKSENKVLFDSIKEKKENIKIYINEEQKLLSSLSGLTNAFKKRIDEKIVIEHEIEKLKEDKIKVNNKIKENKDTLIKGTNIKISADRMLLLLKSEIILNKLEAGGVDNWEWYAESIGESNIEKEAFNEFINLR